MRHFDIPRVLRWQPSEINCGKFELRPLWNQNEIEVSCLCWATNDLSILLNLETLELKD